MFSKHYQIVTAIIDNKNYDLSQNDRMLLHKHIKQCRIMASEQRKNDIKPEALSEAIRKYRKLLSGQTKIIQKTLIHKKTKQWVLLTDDRKQDIKQLRNQIRNYRKELNYMPKQVDFISNYKLKKIGQSKEPKDNNAYFGLEIEGACSKIYDYDDLKINLIKEIPDSYRWICVGSDGSLHNLSGLTFELKVLLPMNNYKDKLSQLYSFLIKHGFNVNKTCGLHVHLTNKIGLFEKLVKVQGYLFKLASKDRKHNQYCRPTKLNSFHGRYLAINPNTNGKNTVEIRLKNATTDISEVLNYLMLLKRIYDTDTVIGEKEKFTNKKIYDRFDVHPELKEKLENIIKHYAA